MKYEIRQCEVDAIQIDRNIKSIANVYFFVGWMMQTGLGYPSGEEGQKGWINKVNRMLECDGIELPVNGEGFEQVEWGDYIIKSEDGRFISMNKQKFESKYKLA